MVVLQLKLADLCHMYSSVEDIFVIFGYINTKQFPLLRQI